MMVPVGVPYYCCEYCGHLAWVEPGVPREVVKCTRCMTRVVECGGFRLLARDER